MRRAEECSCATKLGGFFLEVWRYQEILAEEWGAGLYSSLSHSLGEKEKVLLLLWGEFLATVEFCHLMLLPYREWAFACKSGHWTGTLLTGTLWVLSICWGAPEENPGLHVLPLPHQGNISRLFGGAQLPQSRPSLCCCCFDFFATLYPEIPCVPNPLLWLWKFHYILFATTGSALLCHSSLLLRGSCYSPFCHMEGHWAWLLPMSL